MKSRATRTATEAPSACASASSAFSPHPSIHCHPLPRSDYQKSKSPSFKNGFFPGPCAARRFPARQGGVFPSCVRPGASPAAAFLRSLVCSSQWVAMNRYGRLLSLCGYQEQLTRCQTSSDISISLMSFCADFPLFPHSFPSTPF